MFIYIKTVLACVGIAATCSFMVTDCLAADLTVLPQLLINIRVKERKPLDQLPRVVDEISACETALDGMGRVLVRFSGTEPLARVMVEGPDLTQVENLAERIASAIRSELG